MRRLLLPLLATFFFTLSSHAYAFDNNFSSLTGSLEISSTSTVYNPTDSPKLTLNITSNLGQKIINSLVGIFDKNLNLLTVKDSLGDTILSQNIDPNTHEIDIAKDKLIPGKYTVTLNNQELGTFYWGVLAINTDQDSYTVGDTAHLSLAVLDEKGHMVCDSDLTVSLNNDQVRSTKEGSISVNTQVCNSTDLTLTPDYETSFTMNKVGPQTFTVTAVFNQTTWQTQIKVNVTSTPSPFTIKRTSGTRLYPQNIYPMIIEVKANQDFIGQMVESLPSNISLLNSEPASTKQLNLNLGSSQLLTSPVTNVHFEQGKTYSFHYFYDPPNKSPNLIALGGLSLQNGNSTIFQEDRVWQTAIDSAIEYYVARRTTEGTKTTSGWTSTTGTPESGTTGSTNGWIDSTNLTAGQKYLVMVWGYHQTSDSNEKSGLRVTHGGTSFSESEGIQETDRTGTAYKTPYYWFTVWTAVSNEDLEVEVYLSDDDGTSDTVRIDDITIVAINAEDLVANGDLVYDIQTAGGSLTTTPTAKAGISWTPANDSDTWWISAYSQGYIDTLTGDAYQARLNIDSGTIVGSEEIDGEDTAEQLIYGLGWTQTFSNSSHTVDVELSQSVGNQTWGAAGVFALRLNLFEDFSINATSGTQGLNAGNNVYNQIASITDTPTTTGFWLVAGGYIADDNEGRATARIQLDNSTNITTEYGGWSPATSDLLPYTTADVASYNASTSYTWDFDARETNNTTDPNANDAWMVAFSLELAPVNSPPNTPTLDSPISSATNQSLTPSLLTTSSDTESEPLHYKINLCENVGMSTNCQTFDQTSSQTGWSGQDTPFSAWSYRLKLTIDHTKVAADQTDFPVYVDLSDLPSSFHSHTNQTDARDIRVTKGDGTTELPREVVSYDSSTDTGELYFKYTGTLSSTTDTDVYIYYGNGSASDYSVTDTYGRNNVWSNNYAAVYHLGESGSGSTDEFVDSTGTNPGTGGGGSGSATPTATTGELGNAQSFDGGDYIEIPSDSSLDITNQITLSAWVNSSSAQPQYTKVVSKKKISQYPYQLEFGNSSDDKISFNVADTIDVYGVSSDSDLPTSTWKYVNGTYDGADVKIYVDDTQQTEHNAATFAIDTNSNPLYIGGRDDTYYFTGLIDEVRVSSTARTSEWITTEYNNQTSSSTFYTPSSEENNTPTLYASGSQATYTISSVLDPSTTYYWQSYAIDPSGSNTWSSTQGTPYSFTTTSAPSAPTSPYAEGTTNPSGIVDLTPEFSAVHIDSDGDPAIYYQIQVNTNNTFTGTVMWDSTKTPMSSLASGVRSSDVSYAGTTLTYNGTTYYWRIKFWDNLGAEGAWSATQSFSTNSAPNTPSLDSPSDTAIDQSTTPLLLTTSTDTDSDYLRYKIELCENVGMSTNCQTFDQTSSQTGWSGQNTETSTAYTSSTQASYTLQSALSNNTTYYWRSYAIDPGGSNTWSSTQGTPYSFTTLNSGGGGSDSFYLDGVNLNGVIIN